MVATAHQFLSGGHEGLITYLAVCSACVGGKGDDGTCVNSVPG